MEWVETWDAAWLELMRAARGPALTAVALALSVQGGVLFGSVLIPAAISVGFALRGHPRAALCVLSAAVATAVITRLVKQLVGAERPPDALLDLASASWPSGHSSAASALAVVLALVFRRGWVVVAGALYAAIHMLARTYLGVHWLSDTVAGAALGVVVGVTVWIAIGRPRVTPAGAAPSSSRA